MTLVDAVPGGGPFEWISSIWLGASVFSLLLPLLAGGYWVRRWLARRLISRITEHLVFPAEEGLLVLDARHRVLGATRFFKVLAPRELVRGDSIGKLPVGLYSRLREGLEKAKANLAVVVLEMPASQIMGGTSQDYACALTIYPSVTGAHVRGYMVTVTSLATLHGAYATLAGQEAQYSRLFSASPQGVAIFQVIPHADGGSDGYLLEANDACRAQVEGIMRAQTAPCSEVWPSFLANAGLRGAVTEVLATGRSTRYEFFSPSMGQALHIVLAALPAQQLMVIITDVTEAKAQEAKVLALNAQLRDNLASQKRHLANVLADISSFNEALSHTVEFHLDRVEALAPHLQEAISTEVTSAVSGLRETLHQMQHFHSLGAEEGSPLALMDLNLLFRAFQYDLSAAESSVSLELTPLPVVLARQTVLEFVFSRIFAAVGRMARRTDPVIRVKYEPTFLSAVVVLEVKGIYREALVYSDTTEPRVLDWAITSDLDVGVARRVLEASGGQIYVRGGAEPDTVFIQVALGGSAYLNH